MKNVIAFLTVNFAVLLSSYSIWMYYISDFSWVNLGAAALLSLLTSFANLSLQVMCSQLIK